MAPVGELQLLSSRVQFPLDSLTPPMGFYRALDLSCRVPPPSRVGRVPGRKAPIGRYPDL